MKKINYSVITTVIIMVALLLNGCTNLDNKESKIKMKKEIKIQLLRNATMRITYNGKTILTDPMLSEKETFNGFLFRNLIKNPTVNLNMEPTDAIKNIDAVLVSHTHIPAEDVPAHVSDHFDLKAIELLGKNIPLFVQPCDEMGLKRVGFKNVNKVEKEIVWEGISFKRFRGKHVDVDALLPLIGESSGYIIKADNCPTILWTGDTILTEELKNEIIENSPDIIITHSGGAQLPIDEKGNKATLLLNGESTVEIAKFAPNAKVVAVHLESLDHCSVTRDEIEEKAKAANVLNIIVPKDGEELNF